MVSFLSLPSEKTSSASTHVLLYFISGNPGLIEYYADFFRFLRSSIDEDHDVDSSTVYDIYGRNLLGFSDDEHEPFTESEPPYDLEGEIEGVYDDLAARRRIDDETKPYDYVIIMGHSVGTFIGVEIFHRHSKDPSRAPHLKLRHGFLLFPTLTDIALSSSGRQLSFIHKIPLLANSSHRYAKFLLSCAPQSSLYWVIHSLMGFSPQTATLTAKWLSSRDGVWQALHLGKSELRNITEDRWDEALWEVAKVDGETYSGAPKFYFYYAKDDEWIANNSRDKFIEVRREHGTRGGSTSIEVDQGGIKHAFCTKEDSSLVIAKKVSSWIQEIEQFGKAK